MISKQTIDKYKLDTESLKAIFTADKRGRLVTKLNNLIADRIKEGRMRNMSDYKIWAAVDIAYDTPFAQTTPTLLRSVMDNCSDPKEILSALRGWGLSEENLFFCEDIPATATSPASKKFHLNQSLFSSVFVPLVRAYLVIRLSKIFNDRNTCPLFEYAPLRHTSESRLLCEVMTSVVETIATNFGYSSTLRDFIFNALMYSVSIKFPVEPWVQEKQEVDGIDVIEKEGVRYVVPHISRIFYDLNFPLHTLNTGTGCSYAGYWTIMRWGDIDGDESYWNLDKVPHGFDWMSPDAAWHNYFTEVYPCNLKPPTPRNTKKNDREKMASEAHYGRGDYDAAFFVTYSFMELVPSEWGLGKYSNKVWMKFTVGADDTIMHAEVFPYRPIDYIGYDADSGRGRNASLALEIVPFQDLTGNALTQFLLTIKRNLTNVIFYNNEAVDESQIAELNKKSNSQYAQLNFIGYDGLSMERSGVDINNVFKNVTFPFADPSQSLLSLNTIISILERVLVVAAQEIGSSASHQQSKKEVEIANANTSNRVSYTASFVDEGIDAWKRQIWEAAITHMSGNEIEASVSTDIPNLRGLIQKLGFEFVDGEPASGQKKVNIRGKMKISKLVQLIARRSDTDRDSDASTAQAMLNAVASISNSQYLSSVVDAASLVQMVELAAKLSGADEDFKIVVNHDAAMAGQLQKLVGQIQQQVMASIEKEVAAPVAQAIAAEQKKTAENSQQIEQLTGLLEQIQKAVSASPPLAPPQIQNANQEQPPIAPAPAAAPLVA